MVSVTRRPWHETRPELVAEIRKDLANWPNLHLFIEGNGKAEVRGTFPVRGVDGRELDSFRVVIELPVDYPEDLPIVREVGGRIPWRKEFHVNPVDAEQAELVGTACVIIPEDRWQGFPVGAPFRQYLEVPLHNYFLGQVCVANGEDWPFKEWDHGNDGVLQYYKWLIRTDDALTVQRFVYVLGKLNLKTHWECPCGSGRKIRKCCQRKLTDLRRKIPPAVARKASERLGTVGSPYSGPRFR